MGVFEKDPLLREFLEVGHVHHARVLALPVEGEVPRADIVGHNDNDVGLFWFCGSARVSSRGCTSW